VTVDLAEKLVNALDHLRQFGLPLRILRDPAASVFQILDDFLVLLLFLQTLLESHLQVLLLVQFLEGLDIYDWLVGQPDLFAAVCEQEG